MNNLASCIISKSRFTPRKIAALSHKKDNSGDKSMRLEVRSDCRAADAVPKPLRSPIFTVSIITEINVRMRRRSSLLFPRGSKTRRVVRHQLPGNVLYGALRLVSRLTLDATRTRRERARARALREEDYNANNQPSGSTDPNSSIPEKDNAKAAMPPS